MENPEIVRTSPGAIKISNGVKSITLVPLFEQVVLKMYVPPVTVVPAVSYEAIELPAVIVVPPSAVVPLTVVYDGAPPIVEFNLNLYTLIELLPAELVTDTELSLITFLFVTPFIRCSVLNVQEAGFSSDTSFIIVKSPSRV